MPSNKDPTVETAQVEQELVYSQMKVRRLRVILGIVFALVIAALLATALYFIISSSDSGNNASNRGKDSIHLDEILTGQLVGHRFNGSWSTGSNLIYKDGNTFIEYDVKTKKKEILLVDYAQQYTLIEKSPDGLYLLLGKNHKKIFRFSFEAEYDLYERSSKETYPLNVKGSQHPLYMAQWAPVGNALIFNFDRNLYYKPTALSDEITITEDTHSTVLNGIPDWTYEEEVLSSNSATWFNADGTKIAFIRFDDSATHVMNFPVYGEAGDIRYQYPFIRYIAYPKPGSSNPYVKLLVADLEHAASDSNFLTEVPVPSALNTGTDYLISVVTWLNNTDLLSIWMNRIQTLAYIQVTNDLRRVQIYSTESKTGWVDLFAAPVKNRDGSRIALILPQNQDKDDAYRQLCTLSTTTANGNPEALTKGRYVVQNVLHWDPSSDIIFYTANTEQNSEVLHVFSIKASSGQIPKCLTCKLITSNGVEQSYFTTDFNSNHQVVINSLGPGIPTTDIYEWAYTNGQISLTKLANWITNEQLATKLKDKALPTTEFLSLPVADGFTAKVLLQLPPNIDRSGKTKYPMLVDVYAGPDSYMVVNKWIMDWGSYLSSNRSVIYAKIDGRGSGLRGEKLLQAIYLKMGTVEIIDQIHVVQQLQQMFSFIDANHTGIWGWSYGGYAAAMVLATDNSSVFRCAASIAPVTDWALYDSIYTERYMNLPSANSKGYDNARLATRTWNLSGKKFLLAHGTLDDNVHYQQSMMLAKNLEKQDVLFKQISYPDEEHSLSNVRPHLYHSLDRFFGECFDNKPMMGRS